MKTKYAISGALILAIIFSVEVSAQAGENWDKLSMGAKSAVSNFIAGAGGAAHNTGLVNFGNSIKTTNYGWGSRIGSGIDYSIGALQGAGQSVVSGLNSSLPSVATIRTVGLNATNLVGFVNTETPKEMRFDFSKKLSNMALENSLLNDIPKSELPQVKDIVDHYSAYNNMNKTNWDNKTKASFQKASEIVNMINNN